MLAAKNAKAAGSDSALRINFRFPQGVQLDWGILGMYATKPEENVVVFFFPQGYEFDVKLGHYTTVVQSTLYMELLPKMNGKINTHTKK